MAAEEWTVKSLLEWTTSFFKNKGLDSPRLEAEILLAYAMGCTRVDLFVRHGDVPSEEAKALYRDYVRRRGAGEPVAYLVGQKEFFTLDFHVDRNVLVPRPETEELATAAIEFARKSVNRYGKKGVDPESVDDDTPEEERKPVEAPAKDWKICDVGCGSGCIAVSIAKELPNSRVTAIDISEGALGVAKANAETHEVADRIDFILGDLLAPIASGLSEEDRFDIIVSNPPYVSESEYAALEPTVRDFEPKLALVGGPTGAELPLRLLEQAPERLRVGGKLLMELSPTTVHIVAERAQNDPRWTDVEIVRDLARLERFVFATRR